MAEPIIQVENLYKNYGAVEALRGVSFAVEQGEVFGLLGPNGAGKTSTVEILEGMRVPDRGSARVCGLDPEKSGEAFKERIGAVLQSTALPDKLRVKEAIDLFANFYRHHADTDELLRRFQLEEKRTAFYSQLSGGQKQRLALAMALVNEPEVVFLDEPTAGLDPQVRREIYGIIEQLKQSKKTVLLTTHYIEEAERLCDRVAIVDAGKIIAIGTPRDLLKRSAGKSTIEITCAEDLRLRQLPDFPEAAQTRLSDDGLRMTVASTRPARTLVEIVKWIDAQGIADATNAMGAFTVVRAASHEAAAKLFEDHPHFSIFPGESVEIMPVLPIPGG